MTKNHSPDPGGKIIVRVDPDLEDLIPGFLENRRNDIQAMQEALEQDDFETIRKLSHTMKGVGGGYGFDDITTLSREIEEAAEQRNASGVREGLNKLSGYLDRVEVVVE
jgi:HPt (histidine-containing phosphotransfer) domain-containing protein